MRHRDPVRVGAGSGAPTGLLLAASGLTAGAGAAVVIAVRRHALGS
ncbi:hypothetical protein ACFQ6B_02605 [Streptomyces wedmorensis]|uniref:Uncharacterized protein n=1 Tax=Streptomyces wedmorensis TaxID=43759 RepID=A0ABW6J054_STRWE